MIGAGHPPAAVWGYSPRQLRAYQVLLNKRRGRERAEFVTATQLGTRGDNKEIQKAVRRWLV